MSRYVRPLVFIRRAASSSNSFVKRLCCLLTQILIIHKKLSTFSEQIHLTVVLFTKLADDIVRLDLYRLCHNEHLVNALTPFGSKTPELDRCFLSGVTW